MKDEIFEDEKFWAERSHFVNYLAFCRMVLFEEQKLSSSQGSAKVVEKYKERLQFCEQGYLNYRKWILSKFGKNGLETVFAIASSPAIKRSNIVVRPKNTLSQSRLDAISDECADVCANLAKWEYEAWHLKSIRRVAYATAFVLSVSGIIALIDLIE